MLSRLRAQERAWQGHTPTPSAVVLDSQSVRTTEKGGHTAYDGAKKVNGRKRHLLVDTLGLVCKAHVTPANTATETALAHSCGAWTGNAFLGCGLAGWARR